MNALDALKAIDRRELLYLVMRDTEAKRVLVAWTIYGGASPKKNDVDPEKLPFEKLIQAAWFGTDEMDWEKLGKLAGISARVAGQKFQALAEYGMVYPDGTVNEKALAIIRAEVGGVIRGLAPR